MPRQDVGRTRVNANLSNQTSAQTVYTVTSGKTFFLTGYAITGFNTSTSTVGQINMRDSTTIKIPHVAAKDSVAATAVNSSLNVALNLSEPIPFTTNINIDTVGTITYSVMIVGFEQ